MTVVVGGTLLLMAYNGSGGLVRRVWGGVAGLHDGFGGRPVIVVATGVATTGSRCAVTAGRMSWVGGGGLMWWWIGDGAVDRGLAKIGTADAAGRHIRVCGS